MKFCEKCGSYMERTTEGFSCSKCGNVIYTGRIEVRKIEHSYDPVYVVDDSKEGYIKVDQVCPRCGNHEAFHWLSVISGEHAGVKQERTVEHFKCTRCLHLWSKSH